MEDIKALLGRIALRKGGRTVAMGVVTQLIEWAMVEVGNQALARRVV